MDFLTFSEAANILSKSGIRYGNLWEMVSHKQLYPVWHYTMNVISYESFARFLDYNPLYKDAFYNFDPGDDHYMAQKKDDLIDFMKKVSPVCEEEYSIPQIEQIFGVTKAEIKKVIRSERHFWDIGYLFRKYFSTTEILIYLKNHPDALQRLKERHEMMLSTISMTEVPIRHILMLYSYYQGYGYII